MKYSELKQKLKTFSFSTFSDIVQNGLEYALYRKAKPAETKYFIFGNVYHTLILEPHIFEERVIFDEKTEDFKLIEGETYGDEKYVIPIKYKETFESMLCKFMDNKEATEYLEKTRYKERWKRYNIGEIKLIGKLDMVDYFKKIIVDLKTTSNIDRVDESIDKYLYKYQAAFYNLIQFEGEAKEIAFIFQQKTEPYNIKVVKFNTNTEKEISEILEVAKEYNKFVMNLTNEKIRDIILKFKEMEDVK